MIACLIVVGVVLAAQVSAPPGRYLESTTTGPGAATSNNGGNVSTNNGPMVNLPSAAADSGANRNAAPPPGSASPYGTSPPPGFGNQPTGNPPKQAPSTAYQSPPGFPSDTAAPAQPSAASAASKLLQTMLLPPRDSQLRGDSVSLMQAVSSGRTRSEQTQRVEAYWDLCSSVADYYLGLHEQDELRQLATTIPRPGTTWDDAEKELSVRVGTSLRAARAAQLRLASYMGRAANNLPLPTDAPHCGSFTTNYEQIFARRSSPEAQELAALLPQRYAELNFAAADVGRDEDWFKGIAAARNEGSDGTASLRALKLLALSRRAFVQIARDYNRRIARYSELAMPGSISAEKLSSVLIKRPGSNTATRSAAPSPPPTRNSSGVDSGPPKTFVENWAPASSAENKEAAKRDGAVKPASGSEPTSRQERSLLVPLH